MQAKEIKNENTGASPNYAGDQWDEISEAQKGSIERGIKDMDAGNTKPHSEMVEFYSKWMNN